MIGDLRKSLTMNLRLAGGILVIDNTALGPGKGDQNDPYCNRGRSVRLARTMMWKCALADLPLGELSRR